MKTSEKIILGVIGIIAVVGLFLPVQKLINIGASAVNSTFLSAKVAAIAFSPTTGATTTSILNTDASDRIVTDAFVTCSGVGTSYTALTGAGLASLQFKMATSSTAFPAIISNTNLLLSSAVIATSSVDVYVATTTPGLAGTSDFVRRWAAGSYLAVTSNATNTAACIVGVHYLPN